MSISDQYILIVDDNIGIRTFLYTALTNEGYNVKLAANGIEALIKINEKHPILILLDERMPSMSGLRLISVLDELILEVPVVMITAYSEKIREVVKNHNPIKCLLSKPFDLKLLIKIIKTYVS